MNFPFFHLTPRPSFFFRKKWVGLLLLALPFNAKSQIDEEALGAWYMYFYSADISDKGWGMQGDFQYRNWNIAGDLEQLLLRSGFTYTPTEADIKFTLGYANIRTGAYGESNALVIENRIYQEALFPTNLGRFFLTHRFRFEQRFVEDQDFRTRYRYNLFVNIPLNKPTIAVNAVYLALYNELFINGQRNISEQRSVELFDRNRTYIALGYRLSENIKIQMGGMRQVTDNWSKDQLQFSLHHNF
jgi:hypothetical protein